MSDDEKWGIEFLLTRFDIMRYVMVKQEGAVALTLTGKPAVIAAQPSLSKETHSRKSNLSEPSNMNNGDSQQFYPAWRKGLSYRQNHNRHK